MTNTEVLKKIEELQDNGKYDDAANLFLETTNTKLTYSFVGTVTSNQAFGDDSNILMNRYSVTLDACGELYTFDFHDSNHNLVNNIKPSFYSILTCIGDSYPDTFKDFCSDFGYDNDSIRAEQTYEDCLEQYEEIERLYDQEELKMLQSIA